jgi:cysteinyl-tRNA synthetase
MSRSKTAFEPTKLGKVAVYTCGPTAHAPIHLGEMRRFIVSDLLCRYLTYRGYDLKHVMHITDLDDRTIAGSDSTGEALANYTDRHIDQFKKDLESLGIQPAAILAQTSDHLDDMVKLADKLARKGYAYEKLRSLYFDISRLTKYGQLSGIDINKIRLGATVDLDEYEKDNPRDFTLFKRARLSELKRGIYTKTIWGNVRPSWHLQAAAISMKYLGEQFDIHASSRELMFPHHENVNAISEAATGRPLAKYWIDCDQVMVDGHKVDHKSPALTLRDLQACGYSDKVIRFWMLSSSYRKPITFSPERLESTQQSLNRLNNCLHTLNDIATGQPYPELNQLLYDLRHGFTSGLDDDLNIPAALAAVFKVVRKINQLVSDQKLDPEGAQKIIDTFRNLDHILNVLDLNHQEKNPTIKALIKRRDKARADRNWAVADQLRDELIKLGVRIQDDKC